jgi:NTP pyrophosphatase (non-canonical NTP hydrolase)
MHTSSPENEFTTVEVEPWDSAEVSAAVKQVIVPHMQTRQDQYSVYSELASQVQYIHNAKTVAYALKALKQAYAKQLDLAKENKPLSAVSTIALTNELRNRGDVYGVIYTDHPSKWTNSMKGHIVKEMQQAINLGNLPCILTPTDSSAPSSSIYQEYEQTALATEAPVDEERWRTGAAVLCSSLSTLGSAFRKLHLDNLKKYLAYGKVPADLALIPEILIELRRSGKDPLVASTRVCRFLHGLVGLATEVEELIAAVEKAINEAWNQDEDADSIELQVDHFDVTNILEECGDAQFYLKLILDSIGFNLGKALSVNLNKLQKGDKARYKSGTFTPEEANSRDLSAERKGLEESVSAGTSPADSRPKGFSFTAAQASDLEPKYGCGFCGSKQHDITACSEAAKMSATPVAFEQEVVAVETKAETGLKVGDTVRSIRPRLVGYKFIIHKLSPDYFVFCTVHALPSADDRNTSITLSLGEEITLSLDELVAC